jgi:hypothetical protein
MPWVRLDDGFASHPKVLAAGLLGMGLHVAGLCYANRHLTDGFIADNAVETLGRFTVELPGAKRRRLDPEFVAGQLVAAGLWERVEGGYRIHDYLVFQPSRADVERDREIARRRTAMNANPQLQEAIRARDGDACRYCGVSVKPRDRKGPQGLTYDHVIPVVRGGDESVENLVVACRRCNMRKGGRTPDEAGMPLLGPAGTKPGSGLDLDGIQTESGSASAGITPLSRQPDPTRPVLDVSPLPPSRDLAGSSSDARANTNGSRAAGGNPRARRKQAARRAGAVNLGEGRIVLCSSEAEMRREAEGHYPDDPELVEVCVDAWRRARADFEEGRSA